MATSLYIPAVDDPPPRVPQAAQCAAIRARARASEAIVRVLAELAYGPRLDDDWPDPILFGRNPRVVMGQPQSMEAVHA